VGLRDAIVRKLAAAWIKGKVGAMRKSDSKTMAVLDGNQGPILAFGFVISGLVALATGYDMAPLLDMLLRAIGWTDGDLIESAKALATKIVPTLWSVWIMVVAVKNWRAQRRAGATVAELGSTTGVVKQALAAGSIVDGRTGTPMADTTAPAEAIPFDVAKKGDVVVVAPVK
jgi:hypothetical protein